jgi:hypothetical protein
MLPYRQAYSVVAAVVLHVFAPVQTTTSPLILPQPRPDANAAADASRADGRPSLPTQLARAVLVLERVLAVFLGSLLCPEEGGHGSHHQHHADASASAATAGALSSTALPVYQAAEARRVSQLVQVIIITV